MKKFFFMLSAAIVSLSAVFSSCDDENETYSDLPQVEPGTDTPAPDPEALSPEDVLFSELTTFNDSLFCATQAEFSVGMTRGWRDVFHKLAKVVCADISGARDGAVVGALFGGEGAVIGATVGAALFSWNAGQDVFGYQIHESGGSCSTGSRSVSASQLQVERAYARTCENASYVNNIPTIQLNVPAQFVTSSTLIGKSHNAILDLCKGDLDEAATIEEITGTLSSSQIAVVHSAAFVEMVNKAVASGDYMVDECDAKGNMIIDLFMDVFEECAGSQADLHYIINRYISIIEANGSLSDAEKSQVYNALSVAAYSCDYWEKNAN